MKLAADGQTVMLVSRAEISGGALRLRVQPEVMPGSDLLATARGTSNLLLLHTDLLGTIGTLSIEPGVEQTAYGLFSDLVDVARSI
jgi:homoserine dehydrogenase